MGMTQRLCGHPDDEGLELYALRRLKGPSLTPIQRHLRLCLWCRRRLSRTRVFIAALKRALRIPDEKVHPPMRAAEAEWRLVLVHRGNGRRERL